MEMFTIAHYMTAATTHTRSIALMSAQSQPQSTHEIHDMKSSSMANKLKTYCPPSTRPASRLTGVETVIMLCKFEDVTYSSSAADSGGAQQHSRSNTNR